MKWSGLKWSGVKYVFHSHSFAFKEKIVIWNKLYSQHQSNTTCMDKIVICNYVQTEGRMDSLKWREVGAVVIRDCQGGASEVNFITFYFICHSLYFPGSVLSNKFETTDISI